MLCTHHIWLFWSKEWNRQEEGFASCWKYLFFVASGVFPFHWLAHARHREHWQAALGERRDLQGGRFRCCHLPLIASSVQERQTLAWENQLFYLQPTGLVKVQWLKLVFGDLAPLRVPRFKHKVKTAKEDEFWVYSKIPPFMLGNLPLSFY